MPTRWTISISSAATVVASASASTRLPLDNGKHLSEFTDFTRRDSITAAIALPRIEGDEAQGYLFFATELGVVKRVTLADFLSAAPLDPQVINVDAKDRLGYCFPTTGDQEVILVSSSGKSIRFEETEVRSMGLAAAGVGGMKLKKGERIVGAGVVDADGELMTITESGFAKRSALSDYSTQGRNGGGIVTHKPTNRTGSVASARVLTAAEMADVDTLLSVITAKGQVAVLGLPEVPQMGRGVQGKQVMPIGTGDRPWAIHVVKMPPDDPFGNGGGDEPIAESAAKQPAGGAKKATASKTTNGARAGNGAPAGKQSAGAQSAKKSPQQATLDLGLPAADAARSGTSRQRTSKSGKDGSSPRNAGGDKDKPAPGRSPGRASRKRSAPKTGRGKSASKSVAAEKSTPTTASAKSSGKTKATSAKASSAAKKPPSKTAAKASTSAPGKAKPAPKLASKAASSRKASSSSASAKTASTASTAKESAPSKKPAPSKAKPATKPATKAASSRKASSSSASAKTASTASEAKESASSEKSAPGKAKPVPRPASKAASSTSASGKTTSTASTAKKPSPGKTKTAPKQASKAASPTSSSGKTTSTASTERRSSPSKAKPGPKQASKNATGKAAPAAPKPDKTRSRSTASKESTVPAIQVDPGSKSVVEPSPAKTAPPKEAPSMQTAKANSTTEPVSKQTDASVAAPTMPPAAEDVADTAIGADDMPDQATPATAATLESPAPQQAVDQSPAPKKTTPKSKKPSSKSRKLQIVTTVNKKPASSKKK